MGITSSRYVDAWRLGLAGIGSIGVLSYVQEWNRMQRTKSYRIAEIFISQQNTEETTIKEYAPSFQRIKALYWNILALDGVNPMNSKPHDAWFWGYAFLGALFASFFVRQKMSYKMLDKRLKSTLLGRNVSLTSTMFSRLIIPSRAELTRWSMIKRNKDAILASMCVAFGIAANLVDYLKTDSDTRKYLKAAFPEYEDSMIESLQQDQETSCRLLALIINQNLQHFDREKLEFVAEYVERITQRPTFWDDANTWIQFSPVLTLQYLLDELDSLELGVCFTKYNYALEYLSAAITGRSCPEKVFDIREMSRKAPCCAYHSLLSDLFITLGTKGPEFMKFYHYWTEVDLEYRFSLTLKNAEQQKPEYAHF